VEPDAWNLEKQRGSGLTSGLSSRLKFDNEFENSTEFDLLHRLSYQAQKNKIKYWEVVFEVRKNFGSDIFL
jgi:hypothetical protein